MFSFKVKALFSKTDCNQNKMQRQGFLPCLKIYSCKTWNEKLHKIASCVSFAATLGLSIYSSLWHQTVLKNTEETPENLILCPIFSYIGKTDSITISIWNHKKIHKRQGAGFLGCIRLLSNAISRLKDTGCKSVLFIHLNTRDCTHAHERSFRLTAFPSSSSSSSRPAFRSM